MGVTWGRLGFLCTFVALASSTQLRGTEEVVTASFLETSSSVESQRLHIKPWTVDEAFAAAQKLVGGKKSQRPTFIATYGPPASGKSFLTNKILEQLEIPEDDVVRLLVDDIVEENEGYKRDTHSLDDVEADSSVDRTATNLYFAHRRYADKVRDIAFDTALARQLNIQFETTGRTLWQLDLFFHRCRIANYRTVLVVPYVAKEELLKRLRKRSATSDRKPKEEDVLIALQQAWSNLELIINEYDDVYIFDNSGTPAELDLMDKEHREIDYSNWDDAVPRVVECSDRVDDWISGSRRRRNPPTAYDLPFLQFLKKRCSLHPVDLNKRREANNPPTPETVKFKDQGPGKWDFATEQLKSFMDDFKTDKIVPGEPVSHGDEVQTVKELQDFHDSFNIMQHGSGRDEESFLRGFSSPQSPRRPAHTPKKDKAKRDVAMIKKRKKQSSPGEDSSDSALSDDSGESVQEEPFLESAWAPAKKG